MSELTAPDRYYIANHRTLSPKELSEATGKPLRAVKAHLKHLDALEAPRPKSRIPEKGNVVMDQGFQVKKGVAICTDVAAAFDPSKDEVRVDRSIMSAIGKQDIDRAWQLYDEAIASGNEEYIRQANAATQFLVKRNGHVEY